MSHHPCTPTSPSPPLPSHLCFSTHPPPFTLFPFSSPPNPYYILCSNFLPTNYFCRACFVDVMPPDEFHYPVNNSAYTNMAAMLAITLPQYIDSLSQPIRSGLGYLCCPVNRYVIYTAVNFWIIIIILKLLILLIMFYQQRELLLMELQFNWLKVLPVCTISNSTHLPH